MSAAALLFLARASAASSGAACVGSSANLPPAECAAMQQLHAEWNMSQYPHCDKLDPCSWAPPGTMGVLAVYCQADSDGTGFVQGIDLNSVSPPLKGTISEALGNLTRLTILFLDGNELTGTIPNAFANMPNLLSLNLLANRLSGAIPAGMQSKPWQLLSLGCNALTGAVPTLDFGAMQECDLGDDPAWCAQIFNISNTNKWACPLPEGAAKYCNAKCV